MNFRHCERCQKQGDDSNYTTHNTVMFVSILQVISTLVYMIYVGELSNLIQYQSFRSFSYYCKYLELQEFLKNNRVSKNLVEIVNKYSLHLWRESRGVQVPNFLETAPNCLKLKVMSAAYLHHLTGHHVFECCEPAFLRQLVGHLKLYIYNKGTYVVKQNDITNAMYIIHTGRVAASCENSNATKVYHSGEFFGVVHGLTHDYPHTHSYQSISNAEVLTLRLEDWEYLLNHFPSSKGCIYKNLTNDDGSIDKDKSAKRDRKVTIADVESDVLDNSKKSNQLNPSINQPRISSQENGKKITEIHENVSQPSSGQKLLTTLDNLNQTLSNRSADNRSFEVKESENPDQILLSGAEPDASEQLKHLSSSIIVSSKSQDDMETVLEHDDDISYSNLSLDELIPSTNLIELITKSVEDYIDKTHGDKDKLSLVSYNKSRENVPKIKDEEPTTSFLSRQSVHYDIDKNNNSEENNTPDKHNPISQNIESTSLDDENETNSISSRSQYISERRQWKRHKPSK